MQRGDIVNVIDNHEAPPRLAIVTGLPAEGLVNLFVVPVTRHDHMSTLADVVAVDSEDAARVEGAGEHGAYVAYPLSDTEQLDDEQDDSGAQGDEPDPAAAAPAKPPAKATAAKKTTAAAARA